MTASTLIVTQGLIENQDGVSLHPDLLLWERQLGSYAPRWFQLHEQTPLDIYAALLQTTPTALLYQRATAAGLSLPADAAQYWLASPYHAQLMRETVRVMPEGMFPWCAADSDALCARLNPHLAEEGMTLLAVGAALLLASREAWDVSPTPFAQIAGNLLPNRHHAGADGGRMNRLLSEIQMLLFQQPLDERQARGDVDVSGLWLCSPVSADELGQSVHPSLHVATRNPRLQSMVDGREAALIISEAERLSELLQPDAALPEQVILIGAGYAVLLQRSWLRKWARGGFVCQPKSPRSAAEFWSMLRAAAAHD